MNTLIVISFIAVIGLAVGSNFLYQKLILCIEEIKELKRFNEDIFKAFKNLENQVSDCENITNLIQQRQNNLEESFNKLEKSLSTLKETALEIKSAQQTKKAILDFIKR
ncbi:MAG: hypothetical protein OXN83_04765 [Oligoflexia bacterium]|nr:hypothetical protein [Oligoflexia bacterium]